MMRKAFCIRLKPGEKKEYKRRHDNLWPELSQMMDETGVSNYSIWLFEEDLLFGYLELDETLWNKVSRPEYAALNDRWQEYMSDLITHITDPETGEPKYLELMFLHEGKSAEK